MAAAGDTMDGEYVDLGFLPFSEAKSNKTLAGYLKYIGKDNAGAFGVYGFEAVLAFQEAADAADEVVRRAESASLLTALEGHEELQRRWHDRDRGHRRQGAVELLHGRPVEGRQVRPGVPEEGGHLRLHESNRYTFQADLTRRYGWPRADAIRRGPRRRCGSRWR